MTPSEIPKTASIEALAELFGVSPRQTRNLLEAAKVKSVKRGAWPITAAVRAVLADARRNRDADELVKAKARLMNAKAAEIEAKIASKENNHDGR